MQYTKIKTGIIACMLTLGTLATPTSQALMITGFAPPTDATSRAVVQTSNGSCSGVLIDKEYALTAAHCVSTTPYGEVDKLPPYVLIGPDVTNREKLAVEKAFTHSDYDVALLKLSEPSSITPVKVYTGDSAQMGSPITAYGWGNLAVMKESKNLLPREDRDTLVNEVVLNKVRKAKGKAMPGRVHLDENLQPIKNEAGKTLATHYTGSNGYDRMDGENFTFDHPVKSVYGDSGAPIFIGEEVYAVISGGLIHNEQLGEGSTVGGSPVNKVLGWMNEVTGIDFKSAAHNAEIDREVESRTYSFSDSTISSENIGREKALIQAYKNAVTGTGKVDTNGDNSVGKTPEKTREKSQETLAGKPSETNTDTRTGGNHTDVQNSDQSAPSTQQVETPLEQEARLKSSTYPDTPTSTLEKSQYKNDATQTASTASPKETVNQDSDRNAKVGPKVDTGGSVQRSWIRSLIELFR